MSRKTDALGAATTISSILTGFAKQAEKNGSGLVAAALEKFKANETEKVINKVNQLLDHTRALYSQRERLNAEILLFERRLKAVENNKFKIESDGRMKFEDGFYI